MQKLLYALRVKCKASFKYLSIFAPLNGDREGILIPKWYGGVNSQCPRAAIISQCAVAYRYAKGVCKTVIYSQGCSEMSIDKM